MSIEIMGGAPNKKIYSKKKSGVATSDASGNVTVTGLTFTPSIIILEWAGAVLGSNPNKRKVHGTGLGFTAFNNIAYNNTAESSGGAVTPNSSGFTAQITDVNVASVNYWVFE